MIDRKAYRAGLAKLTPPARRRLVATVVRALKGFGRAFVAKKYGPSLAYVAAQAVRKRPEPLHLDADGRVISEGT